ncbi:MAG: hypothetical protein CVV52_03710 [Spirochaetae bacterium HGW-Spirochaetae-8]|nr:MAG: hypothetical protein CVV52_03710 [Spirochaetae bacterium HGW-Spirochaetae-8]
MDIDDLVKKAHENAKDKGFHDKRMEVGTMIALIHSELSEALEAHRAGLQLDYFRMIGLSGYLLDLESEEYFKTHLKETFEMELADAVIRIADMCGLLDIDLESCIRAKMKYNASRPRLHGKLY